MRAPGLCAQAIAAFACALYAAIGVDADWADPIAASAPSGRYQLDPRRSGVTFDVENLWHVHITMRFGRMRARLEGIDNGLVGGRVTVTIDAASLEANVPFVAGLVKDAGMLDVARYPAIRFASTQFSRTGTTTGLLTGNLTIRTMTRPITFVVTFDEVPPEAPSGRRTLAFHADGHFSRAAFGLSRWSSAVGDDVHMKILAEFVREGDGDGFEGPWHDARP